MPAHLPPLLAPYLSLPRESSLLLLTSVLGASTNWLVLRYIYGILLGDGQADDVASNRRRGEVSGEEARGDAEAGPKVVLVSFLRDLAFWRDGARKLVCLFCALAFVW